METNSTQAVKADTTAQTTVVKRHKRGDVREDGKIFWCYKKPNLKSPYWLTPALFEVKREQVRQNDRKHSDTKAAYRAANREKKAAYDKVYRQKNMPKILAYNREHIKRNPEMHRISRRAWRKAHPEVAKQYYHKKMRSPKFALTKRMRSYLGNLFRMKGFRKEAKTQVLLGCSFSELQAHLETQFLPGMSWENRPDWHIDHIVPCAAARTKEELEALFHYTNLRPLWGADNIRKHAKLPQENELPINLHPKVREIWLTATTTSSKGYPA